ncbi:MULTISPECIES: ATP phosphoribosyltransferase [Pontibacter]|uniref:ATP phosphoribosyltransferase n=1 Tax=Pontibacter amylolyticus TaxID=1424080 RepID=A0ABQ1VWR4_9BACT|nr:MULTISPECIES: ATP phosphoribosyltransferase [Pontibacter]MCP2045019.1 ATP phosphoribosyltransferase [Pontibacter sp. HSC-36F09]GGG00100.1 ATP phosphoribosyltransferase [Pontibacter amylolyticus]
MLRLAIQKSGRLSEDSLKLIRECGISFITSSLKLKTESTNFPLEILYLRDDDIPGYVADGVADIGIVGENVLVEEGMQHLAVEQLGFSKCRLSLAVPKGDPYEDISDLQGKNIATSYPKLLQAYLDEKGVQANIHTISGSVEIAPSIGLAEAICDIVSSGSTLISNGLREVERVFKSQAVLIANGGLNAEKQEILNKLLFRIHAVQRAQKAKYILLNAPNEKIAEISQLLPGAKSPSILPLAEEGWSSLHSVVNEDDFWEIIEKLKEAGAQGILVVPIEKMII